MESYIKGTCKLMCPVNEIKLRCREKLLHFYELTDPENDSKNFNENQIVKSFARSAAGNKTPHPSDLRTPETLYMTVEYLLTKILNDSRRPFNFRYDFIFDRLRSIRQEIVIQNLDVKWSIKLLEPIVMFLSYSSYRLCEESISTFDPKICHQHLRECIKKLLTLYESSDNNNRWINRSLIESLYILSNLDSNETLARAVTLPSEIRLNPIFSLSFSISLESFRGNYYRSIFLIDYLPHILHGVAWLNISYLRKELLKRLSHGFHSKQLMVPTNWLAEILFYENNKQLENDCTSLGLILQEKDKIRFDKNLFRTEEKISIIRSSNVDSKLKDVTISDVILLK